MCSKKKLMKSADVILHTPVLDQMGCMFSSVLVGSILRLRHTAGLLAARCLRADMGAEAGMCGLGPVDFSDTRAASWALTVCSHRRQDQCQVFVDGYLAAATSGPWQWSVVATSSVAVIACSHGLGPLCSAAQARRLVFWLFACGVTARAL